MRKNKKQKTLWIILIIISILAIYLASAKYFAFFPFASNQPKSNVDSPTKLKTEQTPEKTTPDKAEQPDQSPEREIEKDLPTQYEGEDPNSSTNLTGTITYKAVSDGQLVLRTNINQSLGSGSCVLKLTHSSSGRVVTKQVNIIANPSSATCEGFNVATSELGSGLWNINIRISSSGKTGILTSTVEL